MHKILALINKKKITCHLQEFVIPAEHRVKIKGSEKIGKYLDLAKELKKRTKEYEDDGYINYSWFL